MAMYKLQISINSNS